MKNSTTDKEKIPPFWTDTVNGVEVSIYRNVIKGKTLPVYKVSRKKWFEKDGKWESNFTLDRGDWAIARAIECRAWNDLAEYARKERLEMMSAKKGGSEEVAETATPPVME